MAKNRNILVTGAAGFIGMHIVLKLVKEGYNIVGIDNINAYYDVSLKYARLEECGIKKEMITENNTVKSFLYENYSFIKLDILNTEELFSVFRATKFGTVVHLAAQAGVRYSIDNPRTYIENNILGFFNIIDASKKFQVKHFVYASSSSVYGNNNEVPFNELDNVDKPVSLYAATKKGNELIAHVYSSLYSLTTTGLRFFTVYGPWGRPDMAYFSFTKRITEGLPIDVYNNGRLSRDCTYIDDIVNGIYSIIITRDTAKVKYDIFNIGNNKPIGLLEFIEVLENQIGKKAIKNVLVMQQGDVKTTIADISKLAEYGYKPTIQIAEGIKRFLDWYNTFYKR